MADHGYGTVDHGSPGWHGVPLGHIPHHVAPKAKEKLSIMTLLGLVGVPLGLYTFTCFMRAMRCPHISNAVSLVGCIALLTVWCVMACGPSWDFTSSKSRLWTFALCAGIFGWIAGYGQGEHLFMAHFQPYCDIQNLNVYPDVEVDKYTGSTLMDLGVVSFVPGTYLDLSKSYGFKNDDMYCVAPIVRGAREAPYCLNIITGTTTYNDGDLSVSVDAGLGLTPVVTGTFGLGVPVLQRCYSSPVTAVKVQGMTNNGWTGSIQYSGDSGKTYSGMSCTTGCSGSTDSISVAGNTDPNAPAKNTCFDSKACTLAPSASSTASSPSANLGDQWIANRSKPVYDFWAVGTNCCSGHAPDFACGEFDSINARSGLRLMRDDDRGYFKLAVEEASAAYNIRSEHPIFLYWMMSPELEIQTYKDDGNRGFIFGVIYFALFQCVITGLAIATFI